MPLISLNNNGGVKYSEVYFTNFFKIIGNIFGFIDFMYVITFVVILWYSM